MKPSLDQLYKMTAYIYHDANLGRSRESTLLHFVEVCGMLTLLARKKRRERVDVAGALCKALGWYFPLLAKMGVDSVEQLLFAKYPKVCPYCRKSPHAEVECKLIKGTDSVLAHDKVRELTVANWNNRPSGLNEWQAMFQNIYPRRLGDNFTFSTIALLEEIGELAEAIRVFDRHPHYFYGEAADIFSYLMALANEYGLVLSSDDKHFDFEAEYLARFPGLCVACGARVCVCPTLPPATIGRMAKEMPLPDMSKIDVDVFDEQGRTVAQEVLESINRSSVAARRLPYDRGEINTGLTQLAFQLGHALEDKDKGIADKLVALAIELTKGKRDSGTEFHPPTIKVLDLLRSAWLKVDPSVKAEIESSQPILGELTHILDTKILVVTANARGESSAAIRIDKELREIQRRINQGSHRDHIKMDFLTAATVDDLRQGLMSKNYDIIHFAGHANSDGIELLDNDGTKKILEYGTLGDMLKDQDNLNCLVLNACDSMNGLENAIAPVVIAMVDTIDDDESIEFTKGFYDALAAGRSPEVAYRSGTTAMAAEDMDPNVVAIMHRKTPTKPD